VYNWTGLGSGVEGKDMEEKVSIGMRGRREWRDGDDE
jgi:hypothetical protein